MDATTTALISALQTLVASAQSDAAATGATAQTITQAQQVIQAAQASIATLKVLGAGTPGYTVTVQQRAFGTETIFQIAERELGDLTLFPLIQQANDLDFIALTPGQVLLIPQAA
jgi:hypothetical protein